MAYSALAIANRFIDIAKGCKATDLTPMKLQKLIYFAHAWHLHLKQQPLVSDRIEAWDYGPVIPTVYDEFRRFGRNNINEYGVIPVPADDGEGSGTGLAIPYVRNDDTEVNDLLKKIWEVYSPYTALQLSDMTHEKGSPWEKARTGQGGNQRISNDLIVDCMKVLHPQKAQ